MSEDRTTFITLPQVPASDDRQHVLVLLEGERPGQRWPLPAGGLAIGRAPPADIALADPAISRMHCRIVAERGQIVVIDTGSTNGSFIDGRPVVRQAPWPVGSLLRVGAMCSSTIWPAMRCCGAMMNGSAICKPPLPM